MTSLRGPVSPSLNHECGVLVEGFDSPPTFMNTYNLPYYEKLFVDYGFRKSQDTYAFWSSVTHLAEVVKDLEPLTKDCQRRFDIRMRPMNTKKFVEDVRLFLDVFNQSFEDVWGFVPMSAAETELMARDLKALIVPELTTIAEINGEAVGAVFALLDYNPRIKRIDGRLFPFGFICLLSNKKAIKQIRIISANVIPKYQKWGVGLLVVAQLLPAVQAWGIKDVEFSWVLESNLLSFKTLERIGARITKTYRMFDMDICIEEEKPLMNANKRCLAFRGVKGELSVTPYTAPANTPISNQSMSAERSDSKTYGPRFRQRTNLAVLFDASESLFGELDTSIGNAPDRWSHKTGRGCARHVRLVPNRLLSCPALDGRILRLDRQTLLTRVVVGSNMRKSQ